MVRAAGGLAVVGVALGLQQQTARATGVRLRLACPLDPALYDLPLTLETRVPAAWGLCRVTQGATTVDVAASEGTIRYDALPGGGEVAIRPLPDAARPTVDPSA